MSSIAVIVEGGIKKHLKTFAACICVRNEIVIKLYYSKYIDDFFFVAWRSHSYGSDKYNRMNVGIIVNFVFSVFFSVRKAIICYLQ